MGRNISDRHIRSRHKDHRRGRKRQLRCKNMLVSHLNFNAQEEA